MFKDITIVFLAINFATVRIFLRDDETVREALKARADASIIDGYITEAGTFEAI
ncbi:MAG: hypothetical protein IJG40_16100 [Oscillospiraceae bacterium]|nr:hypothetical protein [Oscillospiraceae bacterium]